MEGLHTSKGIEIFDTHEIFSWHVYIRYSNLIEFNTPFSTKLFILVAYMGVCC